MGVRLREYLNKRRNRTRGRRPSRFIEGNLKAAPGIDIDQADIDNILGDIAATLIAIDNSKTRKEILEKAAVIVRDAARNHSDVKDGKARRIQGQLAVSASYDTPKLVGKIKAPKGFGVVRSFVLPGNLRKSIQVLPLKRTPSVFVGPRILRGGRSIYGKTEKTSSGYYAQMMFGSAEAFRKRVMVSALNSVKGQVKTMIASEAKRVIDEAARENGLQ